MTPDELRENLLALGWSQRGLAERLRLHPTTVRRWATGETKVPDNVAQWLRFLAIPHRQRLWPDGWFPVTGGGAPLTERGPVYKEEPADTG